MERVSETPRAPLTTTTSIWPAAAVLIIAVAVLAIFMLINLVADQGVTSTTTTLPVVVGGLQPATSNVALDYCRHTSEIPSNISGGFLVPAGTRVEPGGNIPNAGAGDFDCYQPLVSPAHSSSLLAFYAAQLGTRGWNLFSHGASNGAPQSLFQKAGNDSFYWVIGITVNRSAGDVVHWTFRIYQNSVAI
jgi:hypothetical protein